MPEVYRSDAFRGIREMHVKDIYRRPLRQKRLPVANKWLPLTNKLVCLHSALTACFACYRQVQYGCLSLWVLVVCIHTCQQERLLALRLLLLTLIRLIRI